ncbi:MULTISPECIES: ThiF family adenylyltransferase [Exiguobacterium]|uniref:ThiF family adenylyltransferase n=1 Tax=Exiguobacterium TaxID=33986 RepID=UPI001F0E9AD1|nr:MULTISPECIES: ThiF family adenylyltransferase [Exiguobacterium]
MTNLQRQTLYTEQDARSETPKAVAALERLRAINSDVELDAQIADVSWDWLRPLPSVDLILDATDNVETRLLLNDFALERGIPFLFASCVGAYGMNYTVMPGEAPCLRCLMRHLPLAGQTCATATRYRTSRRCVLSFLSNSRLSEPRPESATDSTPLWA